MAAVLCSQLFRNGGSPCHCAHLPGGVFSERPLLSGHSRAAASARVPDIQARPLFRRSGILASALRASRRKIEVFLVAVFTLVVLFGSLLYVVEGEKNGFTSIPVGVYWAIVTLTTVGYGDISPQTPLGQFIAALIMIVGYAIIAVPTGIVTAEIAYASHPKVSTQSCPQCGIGDHEFGARYCRSCSSPL